MDNPGSSIGNLYKKLKQSSKVVQVAVGYAGGGWLIIQVVETIFPRLHLPDWSVTLVIVLVIIGFPIAIFFAWASERTPAKKYTWLYVVSIGIIAPIGFFLFLKIAKTDLNVPLSPTQSIDSVKLKDDNKAISLLQKTEKQDTSILEHKEDTTITFLEEKK